ncbi:MAG: hypothetical protein LBR89_01930 [Holosporales bacterium]|jgi:hypothetical protein|nr:hypothetical protein [Holosporales bacterium]
MSEKLVKARMMAVIGALVVAVGLGIKGLFPIFMYSPVINLLILLTFIAGMVGPFMHVRQISSDKRFWQSIKSHISSSTAQVLRNDVYSNLLSPIVTTADGTLKSSFSPDETQHMLFSLERKLGERHTVSRYTIGVLVLLGLLGTFWGLTQTIGSITGSLSRLSMDGSVSTDLFRQLKATIQSPLAGMGVAFSSSIFGLIGSMILGFLDLQQGKVEKDFYDMIESDLLAFAKSKPVNFANNGPAYILALLEQTAEALSTFEGRLNQIEDSRAKANNTWQNMARTLSELTANFTAHQGDIGVLCASISELVHNVKETNVNLQNYSDGQVVRNKLEQAKLDQLLDEQALGRQQLGKELASEIRMVARMISMLSEPAEEEEVANVVREAASS